MRPEAAASRLLGGSRASLGPLPLRALLEVGPRVPRRPWPVWFPGSFAGAARRFPFRVVWAVLAAARAFQPVFTVAAEVVEGACACTVFLRGV